MKKLLIIPISALTLTVFMACQTAKVTNKSEVMKTESQVPVQTQVTPPDTDNHQQEAPRISLADAKKDFDNGTAIFIDTRNADAFKVEHVKGAINISAAEVATRYKEIPTDKKIIAYCS